MLRLSSFDISFSELAPCHFDGCRGFKGHFPPPLWIRVLFVIELLLYYHYLVI